MWRLSVEHARQIKQEYGEDALILMPKEKRVEWGGDSHLAASPCHVLSRSSMCVVCGALRDVSSGTQEIPRPVKVDALLPLGLVEESRKHHQHEGSDSGIRHHV
jgi:hypothetical protein